jgi:hypothetical protein
MKKYCPWLLGVGILALLLATQWNWFAMPFERDEGEYSYAAWLLQTGGVPYAESFLQKPPMIIYAYWLGQVVFSDTAVWPPRVLGFLCVALTLFITSWIAWREYGRQAGVWTAFLFVPMVAFPHFSPVAANTEKFMNLPMMLTVALAVYGRGYPRWWVGALAGMASVFAVLFKPICGPVLAVVFVLWGVDVLRQKDGVIRATALCSSVFLGAVVGCLAAFAPLALKGALGAMWESAFVFNRAYAALSNLSMFGPMIETVAVWWFPLVVLAVYFVFFSRLSRTGYWAVLLGVSVASVSASGNGHYYLMLIPFWAVIGGAALGDLHRRIEAVGFRLRVLKIAVAMASVLILFIPLFPKLFLSPRQLCASLYGDNPFLESAEVAKVVADLTGPGDRVYVAGSEPQILFHAKRRSITRFVISYPLMLPTVYAKGYQQEVLQSLTFMPPEVIVFVIHPLSWLGHPSTGPSFFPQFNHLLKTRYTEVGSYIWERQGEKGRWVSPYRADVPGNEYLVVFRKKR